MACCNAEELPLFHHPTTKRTVIPSLIHTLHLRQPRQEARARTALPLVSS